jgi:hypothetical protein
LPRPSSLIAQMSMRAFTSSVSNLPVTCNAAVAVTFWRAWLECDTTISGKSVKQFNTLSNQITEYHVKRALSQKYRFLTHTQLSRAKLIQLNCSLRTAHPCWCVYLFTYAHNFRASWITSLCKLTLLINVIGLMHGVCYRHNVYICISWRTVWWWGWLLTPWQQVERQERADERKGVHPCSTSPAAIATSMIMMSTRRISLKVQMPILSSSANAIQHLLPNQNCGIFW